MTAVLIKGRLKGDKEVARALTFAPEIYFAGLRAWLKDERVKVVGTKKSTKGYKKILSNKPLRRRKGTWSKKVTGLFKGHIPFVKKIGDLKLQMGIFGRHHLHRALEMMQTGGSVSTHRQMPVPIYRNLERRGKLSPVHRGSAKTGMVSAIFRRMSLRGMVGIKSGGTVLYYDPESRKKRGSGFKRSGLLFIGMHRIRIKRQFTGRYDLIQRFKTMQPAIINRGQTAVDKSTRQVEALALHKDDNPHGIKLNPSVKEGDICGAYAYPKNHGAKVLDEWLILIVSTSVSLKTLEKMSLQPVYRSIKTSKIVSHDYYDMMVCSNMANDSNYVKVTKARYSIPFNDLLSKIAGIDFKKVRDPKKKYQPCKKATQLVKDFDGKDGRYLIETKDVETFTSGIGAEQEIIINLDSTPIIYDKISGKMVTPLTLVDA